MLVPVISLRVQTFIYYNSISNSDSSLYLHPSSRKKQQFTGKIKSHKDEQQEGLSRMYANDIIGNVQEYPMMH